MVFLDYLSGKIGLVELRKRYASRSMDDVCSSDSEAVRVANAIIGAFSDYDEGFLSEDQLRQQLSDLLFPSPSPTPIKQVGFIGSELTVKTGTAITVEERSPAFAGAGRALVFA